MATTADSDFNETEDFDDYNPHPYQGGYDIASTYGHPLPPSSKTCYPLHDAAAPAERPEPAEHEPVKPSAGEGVKSGSGQYGAASDWDDYGPGGCFPSSAGIVDWKSGRRGCDNDPSLWAADYLFGYLPVYGERRHESHHYGNLNYAYEKHSPQQPVSVAVEPQTPLWRWDATGDCQVGDYGYKGCCRVEEDPYLVDAEQRRYGEPVSGEDWRGSHLSNSESVNYAAYDRQSYQEPISIVVVDQDVPSSWWPSEFAYQDRVIETSSQYQNAYESNWFTELISPKAEVEHYWPTNSGVYDEDVYSQSEHKPVYVYGGHGSELPIPTTQAKVVEEDPWPYGVNHQCSFLDQLFGHPGTAHEYQN